MLQLKSNGKRLQNKHFPSMSFRAGCCPVGWMTPKSRTTTRSAWKKFLTALTAVAVALCAQRNSLNSACHSTWTMPHQPFSIYYCKTRTASLPGWVHSSAPGRRWNSMSLCLCGVCAPLWPNLPGKLYLRENLSFFLSCGLLHSLCIRFSFDLGWCL